MTKKYLYEQQHEMDKYIFDEYVSCYDEITLMCYKGEIVIVYNQLDEEINHKKKIFDNFDELSKWLKKKTKDNELGCWNE